MPGAGTTNDENQDRGSRDGPQKHDATSNRYYWGIFYFHTNSVPVTGTREGKDAHEERPLKNAA